MFRRLDSLRLWLRSLFGRSRTEQELDDEMLFHIERQVESNLRAGMSSESARLDALRTFGRVTAVKEECRDTRNVNLIENLGQDLRFAARTAWKSPVFTAAAVLTLALGIGATTAIFSVVYGVLLEKLPYKNEETLVTLWQSRLEQGVAREEFAPANFLDVRERNRVFEEVAAAEPYSHSIAEEGEPERLRSRLVSQGFFEILGVSPLHGRTFLPGEYERGRDNAIVLSYGLWVRRFGGDPRVIGRQVRFIRGPYLVAGVMPPEFQYPPGEPAALWAPRVGRDSDPKTRDEDGWIPVVARLKSGVTFAQAQQDLTRIARALASEYPESNQATQFVGVPLREYMVGELRPAMLTFLGAVTLVLLIACANVANLLLVRGRRRTQEFAVRAALGAASGRLARQLMTENLFLALLGGLAGVALAHGAVRMILAWNPATSPLFARVGVHGPVLAFALALSICTALLFGAAPVLSSYRAGSFRAMAPGTRSLGDSTGARRLKNALVVVQLGVALTLLTGAGLLIRSFWNLLQVDPGFVTERVLSLEVHVWSQVRGAAARAAFFAEAMEKLPAVPGVISAAAVCNMPFHDNPVDYRNGIVIEGRPQPPPERQPHVFHTVITTDYFRVMGIPLLNGRRFDRSDDKDAPPVILINQTMANRHWPGEDPLGAKVQVGFPGQGTAEVIGVVADVKPRGLDTLTEPELYLPHPQAPVGSMTFVIRTASDPATLAPAVKNAIREIVPGLAFSRIAAVEEFVAESLRPRQFSLFLLGSFAAIALLLAAIGLYGVISYTVSCRRAEIGLRMALGAARWDILRMVVGEGMTLAALGLILGIAAALGTTHFLTAMLFEVKAIDPATYAGVAAVMALVAFAACLIPAVRASGADPMASLRHE